MALTPITATSDVPGVLFGGAYVWFEKVRAHIEAEAPSGELQLVCNWSDWETIFNAIQGNIGSGGYILPLQWPGISFLYLNAVNIEPAENLVSYMDASGLPAVPLGRMSIRFGKLKFDPQAIATGELHIDFATQSQPLSIVKELYQFSNGDHVGASDNPMIRYGTASFQITRYNLTSLPTTLSLATAGQVNSDTFYGAAPGTMYYEGMSDRKTLGYGFGNLWSVTFSFSWRSIPWNKLFHKTSSGGQFEGVALIGAGGGSGSGSAYDGINGPFYTATPFAPFLSLT